MTFRFTSFLTNGTLQLVKSGTGDRPRDGDNCLIQCVFEKNSEQEEIQGSGQTPVKFWLPFGRGLYSNSLEQIVGDLSVGSECVIRSSYAVDDENTFSIVSIHLSVLEIVHGEPTCVDWKTSNCVLEAVSQLKQEAKHILSHPSEQAEYLKQAIGKYEEALDVLHFRTIGAALEETWHIDARISLHCNLAICYNRLLKPYMAWLHSNAALKMRPTEAKAVFQRAKAYLQIGDLVNALRDMKTLESLCNGSSIEVKRLKTQVEQAIDCQSQQNEKEVIENFQLVLSTRSFSIPSDI